MNLKQNKKYFIIVILIIIISVFLFFINYSTQIINYNKKSEISIAVNEKRELIIIENNHNIIIFSDSLTYAIHSLLSSVIYNDYYNNIK